MANPITKIIITAKDEASAVFGSLKTTAAGVAAAIGGYFSGKFLFGDIVGSARDFERAMSAVQAASGATGAELQTLRAAAEQAGSTTRYSSVEAASALETLSKAGLNASQAVQALPAVLNLAQAGGVDLGVAADYVTKAVNGMGLSFGEAGRVADVLSQGANASSTSVEGLAGALSYAAPLARSLGLSLEQTVAIIGKFADAGIDASRAGTALNSILAQFSDPASKFRRELADAGITTSDFDQALRQLAAAGPAGQRAINAVGQEAGPALRALLNQGMGALDDLRGKLENSAGSAKAFGDVVSGNLDGALKGLGSAWSAMLIKLGTPALDTLRNQVTAIAAKLQEFVANGTATRFGEAIRAAFEAAGKWAADFIGKVDFTKLAADLQSFAARAGEYFASVGEKARTASAVIETAWGVMSAGVNTVLSGVYRLGQGLSWLTSAFLADLATITQGLAKITFGDISAGFAQAAASMQVQAQAAYSVFEEFGRKAGEAFDAAASGAESANSGWAKLTAGAQQAATETTAAMQQVAEQVGITADQLDALGANAEVSAGKVVQAGSAAQQAAGGMTKLADGAKKAVDSVAAAAAAAEQVEAAFQRLGVTSSAELQRTARNAQRDFETIRDGGTASTRDIQAAFAAYAEKAIDANNGVANSVIRAQAAQYRLEIAADSSGKTIVTRMEEGKKATDDLSGSASDAADQYQRLGNTIENLPTPSPSPNPSAPADGTRPPPGPPTYNRMYGPWDRVFSRAEELGGMKLRKEMEQFFLNNGGKSPVAGMAGVSERTWSALRRVSSMLDDIQMQQEEASGRYQANKPKVVETSQREQVTTYRVQVGTGAGRTTTINTASQADANALTELLRQLESDMSRS